MDVPKFANLVTKTLFIASLVSDVEEIQSNSGIHKM